MKQWKNTFLLSIPLLLRFFRMRLTVLLRCVTCWAFPFPVKEEEEKNEFVLFHNFFTFFSLFASMLSMYCLWRVKFITKYFSLSGRCIKFDLNLTESKGGMYKNLMKPCRKHKKVKIDYSASCRLQLSFAEISPQDSAI